MSKKTLIFSCDAKHFYEYIVFYVIKYFNIFLISSKKWLRILGLGP